MNTDIQIKIRNNLRPKQTAVSNCILAAAESYFTQYSGKENFVYDLNQCEKEAFNLSQGKDLCYDRPSIGLSYSLWYLGRRINTTMSFMIDLVADAVYNNKRIELLDLGAGTGAIQIALGLCLHTLAEIGYTLPYARVINIDISPFMLSYHRDFLNPVFSNTFSNYNKVQTSYSVNSWTNPDDTLLTTPILIASYLFDHFENQKAITQKFKEFIQILEPDKIVLLTSNQQNKKVFLDSASVIISGGEYRYSNITPSFLFKGVMKSFLDFRRDKNASHNTHFSTRHPSWDERSFYAKILSRDEKKIDFSFPKEESNPLSKIDLYIPEIAVRRDIILNMQQQKAAEVKNPKPTIITGPAGCGKSIVITERIKNLCEAAGYNPSLRILLTTFNKALCGCLSDWLVELLDENKYLRKGNSFYFNLDAIGEPNIRIMHFDIIPTQIGGIFGRLQFEPDYKHYIQKSIDFVCEQEDVSPGDYKDIFNPIFLYNEYIRVIYGRQYETLDAYQIGERPRRSLGLRHNSKKRELIWKVTRHCLDFFREHSFETIHTRRHKMLRALKNGQFRNLFTHIFVDEFQDCTEADYKIFYGLIKDNNNLVIAGDYAQAVHLGNTASVPRASEFTDGKPKMGNRVTHKLEGSYRLPFRISQCIRPLSEKLKVGNQETDIITPYKGSPPGARPIVIYATDTQSMFTKICWVIWYFNKYQIVDFENLNNKHVTILERDKELYKAFENYKANLAVTDSVLKLKGLEKECIIWSTRAKIKEEDVFNFIYTILTRTSSVLIIALFPDLQPKIKEALCLLNQEYLMLWDEATASHFRANYPQSEVVQETDSLYSQL